MHPGLFQFLFLFVKEKEKNIRRSKESLAFSLVLEETINLATHEKKRPFVFEILEKTRRRDIMAAALHPVSVSNMTHNL